MSRPRRKSSLSADGPPVVILTGFMGTGKTAAGRELAAMLGLPFLDLDEWIEGQEGMKVAGIFRTRGERHFRAAEEAACAELQGRSGVVVATGGGAVLSEKNFKALSRAGSLILLTASPDEIVRRVGGEGDRPLLAAGLAAGVGAGPDASAGAGEAAGAAAGEAAGVAAAAGVADLKRRIENLLASRESAYGKIACAIDTTGLSPRAVAWRVAASLDLPARTIEVRLEGGGHASPDVRQDAPGSGRGDSQRSGGEAPSRAGRSRRAQSLAAVTRIAIGRGLLSGLGSLIAAAGLRSKVFVLMAERVRGIFLDQIAASLGRTSLDWDCLPVRDGDAQKDMGQVEELLDGLAARAAERDSVAVAVGGGVTGDLAGFVASIYMRGIPLVQVPTTLLAQVDSSIGGKVGVNHALAKNLAGSFYHPRLVVSDPCALRTLPPKEIANGMAEVIKTAIVGSPELFEFLEARLLGAAEAGGVSETSEGTDPLRDVGLLERCVVECATVKARIVERDPYDRGARRCLNLGHSIGHALEATEHYSGLTHGEAVSVGLVAALRIAGERGLVGGALLPRTRKLLARCGLPIDVPDPEEGAILRALALDKKKAAGRLHFVLPAGLGSTTVVDDVTERELLESLHGEKK